MIHKRIKIKCLDCGNIDYIDNYNESEWFVCSKCKNEGINKY